MRKTCVVIVWAVLSVSNAMANDCGPNDSNVQTTPTADFTDHGDSTITHKRTGLMWKQCLEGSSGTGCATGLANTYNWQEALQLADGYIFAGYIDWRLPNPKELASIVERKCVGPSINLSVFPNGFTDFYQGMRVWSGSPNVHSSDSAWVVDFGEGYTGIEDRSSEYNLYVRLVRGGQ